MKNLNFLIFALLCASCNLFAQQKSAMSVMSNDVLNNLYIEAEDWNSELNCVINATAGKTTMENVGYSNGKAIQLMSGAVEYVTTYVINGIPQAGTYNLNLKMGYMKARAMFVGVNQQTYQKMFFVDQSDVDLMGLTATDFGTKTAWGWMYKLCADWYAPENYVLPVYLEQGTNTVTMTSARHPWYDQWFSGYIDYFTVTDDATITVEKPTDQCATTVRYDLSNVTGACTTVSGDGFTGGAAIQLSSGQSVSMNLDMPRGGIFYFDLFYCSDAERGLKIVNTDDNNKEYSFVSVNNKTNLGLETLEFSKDTAGVDIVTTHYGMMAKRFEVTLKQGVNHLILSPVGNGTETSSPVLDMVCINNDRPLIKPATYNLLMSDSTKLSCQQGTEGLANIADNDESTAFVIKGAKTADIVVELNYAHILMGYRIISSLENAAKVNSMTVMGWNPNTLDWVSIPYSTNSAYTYQELSEYHVRTNYGINSGYGNGVSYPKYKITVLGVDDINISEIQLYGMPLKNGANDIRITGNLLQDVSDDASAARLATDMPDALGTEYTGGAVNRMPSRYSCGEDCVLESYLEYDLVTPSTVGSYLVGIPYNRFSYSKALYAYTTTSPKDFVLKGLNTNSEWVVLHQMKSVEWPFMGIASTFNTDDNKTVCSKLRLEITDNCGGYRTEVAAWQAFPDRMGSNDFITANKSANLISKVVVYANDKKIYISGMEGAYKIVDLMGRTISQGFVNNSVSVDVMTGLYIVVTENGVKKVSVR